MNTTPGTSYGTPIALSKHGDDVKACKALIISLIYEALDDIKKRQKRTGHNKHWTHAYDWIFSESFEIYCDLMDFDPAKFRAVVNKLVSTEELRRGRDEESKDYQKAYLWRF
jgi:hypothetical protein